MRERAGAGGNLAGGRLGSVWYLSLGKEEEGRESPHSVLCLGWKQEGQRVRRTIRSKRASHGGRLGAEAAKDTTTMAVVERLSREEKTKEREGGEERAGRGCEVSTFLCGAVASAALATLLCSAVASVVSLVATTASKWGASCVGQHDVEDDDEQVVLSCTVSPCLAGGDNDELLGHSALKEEVAVARPCANNDTYGWVCTT